MDLTLKKFGFDPKKTGVKGTMTPKFQSLNRALINRTVEKSKFALFKKSINLYHKQNKNTVRIHKYGLPCPIKVKAVARDTVPYLLPISKKWLEIWYRIPRSQV